MKTVVVLLAMLALSVSGKSIDNPAENPDRPSGMVKAVPTVVEGGASREGKSIAVPPPVQVTSGVVTVLGDARKGRVIEIGADGIPIIHGVRVPDDPSDTKIYRNARIVNNKLITAEDELRLNGVKGRALSSGTDASSDRRVPRILTRGGGAIKFETDNQNQSQLPSQQGQLPAEGQRYPDFYYKKYYNNERVGVIAESSFEDDNISTSSEQVVSYSYLAAPGGNVASSSSSKSSTSNNVVYGSGAVAKPPGGQNAVGVPSFTEVKTSSILHSNAAAQPVGVPVAAQSVGASIAAQPVGAASEVDASISNAVPFGHDTTPAESFAVHQAPVNAQFRQQPFTHPPHAPPTVFQSSPNDFVIQNTVFQAHPGAPTFNVPIPVPTQQAKHRRRHPFHRNQNKASSEVVEHVIPVTGDLSYTSYNPYDIPTEPTKKPIYQKMMEPFMKAGKTIYKMASPVFDPMIEAGQRITQRFRIPSSSSSHGNSQSSFSLQNMNDYISRTVDENNLPVVAGVAALAAITLGVLAVAASSNVTLGKRSIEDPAEEFLYQALDPYPMGEPTMLNRLEEYTTWTDSKCSKRIFCDVMTLVGDDTLYSVEKQLDMFLRVLNRGSEEGSALRKTADDVMQAVRKRSCNTFSCGGSGVDSSKVIRTSAGPR